MARSRVWVNLSPIYRRRLERAGISQGEYESGTKLQQARGQAQAEPARTERIREEQAEAGLPARSTYNRWKRRAKTLGVTEGDWESAIGASDWDAIPELIRERERDNREWRRRGRPWKDQRGSRISFLQAPEEWGSSWNHYHN